MATHDYVIANGSGAAVRSDLNNALAAIVSNNSSSTEPSTTYAFQWWADTNASLLKLRNSANNAWITIRSLDGSLTVADGSAASPALAFTDDTNTGVFSGANDTVGLSTAGVERFNVKTTEVVVNDPSNDVNFRVESNNAANMLFVDGGTDRVGINEGAPDRHLHVNSGSTDVVAKFESTDSGAAIELVDNNATSKINQVGAALEISSDSGNADADSVIRLVVDGSTKATVDSSGRLLVGKTTSVEPARRLQIAGTDSQTSSAVFTRNSANNGGPVIDLVKSRNASHGSFTVVQDNDILGTIQFRGDDGADYLSIGASISAVVDGSPGANDVPSRLVFGTTADAGNSTTERARITSGGYFKASNNGSYEGQDATYHEFTGASDTTPAHITRVNNTSFGSAATRVGVLRSASQLYQLAEWYTGNGTDNFFHDTEYRFRGDGSAFADGDWNTGGADYAEYFEWSDGNASDEDRRGISVVLDGDKIRTAVDGEDPIGVISGNPSVVGDAAWNKWSGKYLRDDYGSYVLNSSGERQLNPDYDPNATYVPREERAEWDCVGLMGKLRIRKGQVIGSRWIKMRDVSATVEEWLVR